MGRNALYQGKMRPKPVTYGGIQFRSTLEARWAVFFDALGLEWRYEHQWYDLPSGKYLPDFWLPGESMIIEIKPAFDEYAMQRLAELNEYYDYYQECFLFTADDLKTPTIHSEDGGGWRAQWEKDGPYKVFGREWWGYCPVERKIFTGTEAIEELCCGHGRKDRDIHSPDDYTRQHDHPILRAAFQQAQRARF